MLIGASLLRRCECRGQCRSELGFDRARRLDEGPHLGGILSPWHPLDAARDVDAVRAHRAHGRRDVRRATDRRPASGTARAPPGRRRSDQSKGTPVPPGSCVSPGRRVSSDDSGGGPRVTQGLVGRETRPDAHGLERRPRQAGERLRRLLAVELQHVEPDLVRDPLDLLARRVHERRRPAARRPAAPPRSPRPAAGVDASRAHVPEDEAERVGARIHGEARVLERPDAADLHEQPPRFVAASNLSAPITRPPPGAGAAPRPDRAKPSGARRRGTRRSRLRASRFRSWPLRMPLSATATTSSGIRGASRATSPASTASVRRSRLLTPTTPRPGREGALELGRGRGPRRARRRPTARASPSSRRSSPSESAATISSTASAPAARASEICHGSSTKSLRSTGSPRARARASARWPS